MDQGRENRGHQGGVAGEERGERIQPPRVGKALKFGFDFVELFAAVRLGVTFSMDQLLKR